MWQPKKTDRRDSITKRRKALSVVRNAMTNLPTEVGNFSVQRKEKKLTPDHRPVTVSKRWQKFGDTMRLARI